MTEILNKEEEQQLQNYLENQRKTMKCPKCGDMMQPTCSPHLIQCPKCNITHSSVIP